MKLSKARSVRELGRDESAKNERETNTERVRYWRGERNGSKEGKDPRGIKVGDAKAR